jgi:predicted Zn finger-like uncharacterized protein
MKNFKCGNCKTLYSIDESKIAQSQAVFTCKNCGAKNQIKFGIRIQIQYADKDGKTVKNLFQLKEGVNTIGRKSNKPVADILIDDDFVSRKHVAVYLEKKDNKLFIFLEDLNSSNGTFNAENQRLEPGKKYPMPTGKMYRVGNSSISLFN